MALMQKHYQGNLLIAVDLFSGGGGLTVGLKRAGFSVVGAVEIDQHAAATFKANHPESRLLIRDIREVTGQELLSLSPTGKIDLLAGCPPCQGFSSLTAKYKRVDWRNELVLEMGRLIEEIQPRAVMMENVPGLADRGIHLFQQFLDSLYAHDYQPVYDVLQVADFGVPQLRRRLVLVAGKGFRISLPGPTHSRCGERGLPRWATVRDAIQGMPRPKTMSEVTRDGGPQKHNWHVVRDLSDENKNRLRFAKAGLSWREIPRRHRPKCHKSEDIGFPNVYGRMRSVAPAPTITGGCTTLSKGRFGHPKQLRTISVREAALLQTFPMDYIINTDYMEHACNIIGNALPCDFAETVSERCAVAIQANS